MRYEKWSWGEMRRQPVSLAAVPGVEDGKGYQQRPVDLTTDNRGAHMMARAKARRAKQMRQFVSIWGKNR